MRAWLTHGVSVVAIGCLLLIGLTLIGSAAGFEAPIWLGLVWLPLLVVASVPLGRALRRWEAHALMRALRDRHRPAFVAAADIGIHDLLRLMAPVIPAQRATPGARNRFGITASRAVQNLVAVFTDTAVEFWTGPRPGETRDPKDR